MANAYYNNTPATQNYGAPLQTKNYPEAPAVQSQGFGDDPAIAREVATVQGQILIAKRFPRDVDLSLQKIERACSRTRLASLAIYQYQRGGTDITGPSIRLAEAVASAWGNVKYGFDVMESNTLSNKVRAYAYDMESNVQAERIFSVSNMRFTRAGQHQMTDPRDIYENIANNASRRIRACILEIIPADVIEYAMECCDKTIRQNIKITPESLDKLCAAFAEYGVTKIQIEAKIQRNLSSIGTAQYIQLRNIYTSLKDGIAKAEDCFPSLEEAKAEREGKNAQQQPQERIEQPQVQQSMADSALSSTTTASAASQPQPQPQPQAMGYDSSTADVPLNGPENFEGDDFDDLVF